MAAQHEYLSRVGSLYYELDLLDRKIKWYQQIEELVKSGATFTEAERIMELMKKQNEDAETDNFSDSESRMGISSLSMNQDSGKELKVLYRKLVSQYHPDLVTDKKAKLAREKIMKKIIQAYNQQDLGRLERIADETAPDHRELSTRQLITKLERINDQVNELNKQYSDLIKSEWNKIRLRLIMGLKDNRDVLREIKIQLLADLSYKKSVIADYEKKFR